MAFDFQGADKGAGTGASIGGAIGSIIPGVGTAIGTAAGGLIGGAAGGFFGREKSKETKIQKRQRQLVDEMLGSLNGSGPYADLFNANEADFERSFANPARSRFRNLTAPQIQQRYIASGMQNSTGLEDTLTRAGVDMDSLINQHYLDYVQSARNRKANALGSILGQDRGALPGQSGWDAALQGVGGYLSSDAFGKDFEGILNSFNKGDDEYDVPSQSLTDTFQPARKGFENDPSVYNPYTGIQTGGY